uniref:Tripartite motif containing 35-13 n=1 Tax=Periophthalmus magnuspinnatus TaxID=409849 RepID=A0A3B4BJU5_9GOBI
MSSANNDDESLSCPICRDVFKDSIVLTCSHSFCQVCIEQWWTASEEEQGKKCPICIRSPSRKEPIQNLALKNAAKVLERWKEKRKPSEEEKEEVCSLHGENLQLFCLRDFEPVCLVCRDAKAHEYHPFRPVTEAVESLRVSLEEDLTQLTNKLDRFQKFQENGELCLRHIKRQSAHAKKIIQDEFKNFHEFLMQEEETRIKALREEEEQKTQRIKDKMEAVNREIEALTKTIKATEEQLGDADVSFLLKYKAVVARVQRYPLVEEPQVGPGALIDQAKHLGNLAFNIWSSMKTMVHYSPVILDPNTAHPELVLSDDLTSFALGEEQKLPKNPERIRMDIEIVRGSVGLDSGSHSWDVYVGECTNWELGVVTESAYCILDFKETTRTFTAHKREVAPLKVQMCPHRIRLHLECDKRKLTFYDADNNKVIHAFVHIHEQKLFPVFVSGRDEQMTILPKKILDKLFE